MAATDGNELLELFTRYNQDLWPVHLIAYGLAVAPIVLLYTRRREASDRLIAGILAGLWLWLGVVFQAMYATDIDLVLGTLYALMFVLQAFLLVYQGVVRRTLVFRRRNRTAGLLGWVALAYAVLIYPLLGHALGHGWPEAPLLGMAPCPTTIATFGFLLLATPPIPRRVLVIPAVWALIAPPAALDRGVYEDLGLLIAGVATVALILARPRPRPGSEHRSPSAVPRSRHNIEATSGRRHPS